MHNVYIVVGWVAWIITAILAGTFTYGIRKSISSGVSFQIATAIQAFSWWVALLIFLFTPLNKLHLLWIVPFLFFCVSFIVLGNVIIIKPLLLFLTRIFVWLVSDQKNKVLPANVFSNKNYSQKGNLCFEKGDYDQAIYYYSKIIEIDPRDWRAYNNRGNSYFQKGDYEKAIMNFTKSIGIHPGDIYAYNNRANAYDLIDKYDLALSDYNRAIEINPNDAGIYFNKALTYEKTGNKFEAIRAFKEFLNYASSSHISFIEEAKKKIKELEKYI